MAQDEWLVFRDGQTLVAEGGVGLEVKGGSKGSGMVLGFLSLKVAAVLVGGGCLGCYLVLSLRGD